jgi:hypothetical protein
MPDVTTTSLLDELREKLGLESSAALREISARLSAEWRVSTDAVVAARTPKARECAIDHVCDLADLYRKVTRLEQAQ